MINATPKIAEDVTLCQCLRCGEVKEFKELSTIVSGHGAKTYVCPICKGSVTYIKTKHDDYLDKFLVVNDDPRYY